MAVSRRRLLGVGALLLARRSDLTAAFDLAAAPHRGAADLSAAATAEAALNPNALERYVDPLPIPPIARPAEMRPSPVNARLQVPYYRIAMRECLSKVHRDVPATKQWGYEGGVPGPTLETRSGAGLLVEWTSELPARHLFAIDHRLHGAESDKPDVRTVTHVHGAKAPPESDGYPEDWFVGGKSRTDYYPNAQEAALLWYHDHAMGITRLNVYAGLFGAFVIRDAAEEALDLPSGACEIPLVLYDRNFTRDGQLSYPTSGDPAAPWVSEVYGSTTLCNGKIFPYLEVEPRRYRLRVLNAANGRNFNLRLSNGESFQQIGSDQGLLAHPITLSSVLLFPAERVDLIVDFSEHAGSDIRLKNQANEILQFRVLGSGGKGRASAHTGVVPEKLRDVPRIAESAAVLTRTLTLDDHSDHMGNPMLMLLNGQHWDMPITERPVIDSVEIWSFINLTDDTHPMHLHLVRFQVLDRRPFDLFAYNATRQLKYTGPAIPPASGETGWKDTVRTDPRTVTRIIMRFEGFLGRYVWHCHLLEHEDNEMMRPFAVVAVHHSAQ
jgi:spore coat protein A, manganese oxidase